MKRFAVTMIMVVLLVLSFAIATLAAETTTVVAKNPTTAEETSTASAGTQMLTTISPFVILIITQFCGFIVLRYNLRKPQRQSKLDERYQKVLAPLHQLLFFSSNYEHNVDDPQLISQVEQILADYYYLAPQLMIFSWNAKNYEKFADQVAIYFNLAFKELGYTQQDAWMKKVAKMIERKKITTVKRIERLTKIEAYLRKAASRQRRISILVILYTGLYLIFLLIYFFRLLQTPYSNQWGFIVLSLCLFFSVLFAYQLVAYFKD